LRSGDANGNWQINVGDTVFVLNYVFSDGMSPREMATADGNCDGTVNVADAVRLISFIFRDGTAPCHP
jgi:hypothetical protein